MTDFLLELRSEEIPARMQDKARDDLARLFTAELTKAGIATAALETYATPRRLTLIARDLPLATAAASEETKGPKSSAPPQALEGFLRKTGLTREQLVERDGVFFAVIDKPGRGVSDVLADAISAIIRAFPWPKSMRWGAASQTTESLKWVRPLQGIVALFGDDVVPFEIAGITSGAATVGHRFHHPGVITIGSAADYVEKLRACHVIVDQAERRQIIALGATMAARKAGLELLQDEGLLTENAGLTEWPAPLLGQFDAAFLSVPPEVIQLTARVNQKYFVCQNADSTLANAFVCTANIDATDGGAKIVEGNRKVLAARLGDAKFFWEQDLKVPLEKQAKKLDRIVFHEKLGTVADKVERVAKLARWLVEEGIIRAPAQAGAQGDVAPHHSGLLPAQEHLADMAERAARLSKADLVTGMVGEFPELQGLMGGYYAAAQAEDPRVAAAIRDHYKPVGQGDDVPTDPVTVAVSLADKLDTLVGFFAINQIPTGSKDPFALRRQMLAVISLVEKSRLRLPLHQVAKLARDLIVETFSKGKWVIDADRAEHGPWPLLSPSDSIMSEMIEIYPSEASRYSEDYLPEDLVLSDSYDRKRFPPVLFGSSEDTAHDLTTFMLDRLRVRLREKGVRHDAVDAFIPKPPEDITLEWLLRDLDDHLADVVRPSSVRYRPSDQILAIEVGASALDEILSTTAGEDALYVYRRATKILADVTFPKAALSLAERGAPEEVMSLARWLEEAEAGVRASLLYRDLKGAVSIIATGKVLIDAFFENVVVNDPDPNKRAARLALLSRVRDAVHAIADFSKIEG